MKRTLLLAGCLVLCAGCAKKPGKYTGVLGKADVPPRLIVHFTFDGPYAAGDFAYASQKIAGDATALSVPAMGCMGRILDVDGDVDLGNCVATGQIANLEWTSCIDMKTNRAIPCPDGPQSKPLPPQKKAAKWSDILKPLPDQDGVEMDIPADPQSGFSKLIPPKPLTDGDLCISRDGLISCGLPPMVAPTMRDVVTHSQELSCPKGYSEKHLLLGDAIPQNWQEVFSDEYLVCVTPAFIAELKKANGEK